ncbi:MAG: helix-turn-helix domain-containing protein [Bacteroidales bacterium]|nr:helix-turn-helix domain-containing protein [Bacteroidales bacterium]MBR5562902.1 helix-turn-helix domain-containing protein [Bacteroidales bacterium]
MDRNKPNIDLENLLDGQDIMQMLHVSPRTLQTLRSNGTIPYTRIGRKIYYLREDIERILRNNYIMTKIEDRYGKE